MVTSSANSKSGMHASAMQLENRHVLVTGAGSGIGREIAIAAAKRGMIVALSGRREYALQETLRMMGPPRGHAVLPGDITDPQIRVALAQYIAYWWGKLDVLVNNAGLVTVGPHARASDDDLEQVIRTNFIAPAALIREMLPLLIRAKPSRIVNVGSMFGDIAYPLFGAYSASKFALRGLSIALRRELKEYGIGVTYAAPRATKTDAASAFGRLVEPMQMRIDAPETVATEIWTAVARDRDSVYARGPERLFVLVQRILPQLVDRSIAQQLSDKRIRAYLVSQGVWPAAIEGRLR
jgi:NAD(P)-dependent dehydrogenase (short-subunit alcohol dehydrogenase family)